MFDNLEHITAGTVSQLTGHIAFPGSGCPSQDEILIFSNPGINKKLANLVPIEIVQVNS